MTASELNNLQTTIGVTNAITSCIDDYSATTTQMQTTSDPYPGATPSLATSLQAEITALRHAIVQGFGWPYWYAHSEDISRAASWTAVAVNRCLFCGTATITNTHASSRLLDLMTNLGGGAVSRFTVDKDGEVVTGTWNATPIGLSYGGLGQATGTPVDGQLLVGHNSGFALAHLTAGTGISIASTGGRITITNTVSSSGLESGTWTTNLAGITRTLGGGPYQNTSGRKRRVALTVTHQDADNPVSCDTENANPPTLVITRTGPNGAIGNTTSGYHYFEVPNNWYYECVNVTGTATLVTWRELDE